MQGISQVLRFHYEVKKVRKKVLELILAKTKGNGLDVIEYAEALFDE